MGDFVTRDGGISTPLRGPLVEFKLGESLSRPGWHLVKQKTGSGAWEVVASVFGKRRAETVRDALTAETNDGLENAG